jgi:hypothetical protein
VSFEELKTSHNNLKESCENLKEAQKPSCVHDIMIVTKDVGVTCDLLDSPTSEPHTTNILFDKCKMSLMNDNIVCDESQAIVDNEMLVFIFFTLYVLASITKKGEIVSAINPN